MSMTKAEKQRVEELGKQVALLRAWRLTDEVKSDVPAPSYEEKATFGWIVRGNEYGRCEAGSSDSSSHFTGSEEDAKNFQCRRQGRWMSGTQRSINLFSRKSLAWRAFRNEREREMMKQLAAIDAQIEACELEESQPAPAKGGASE